MKLAGGLIFYEDLQSLQRGVPTFIDQMDVVYAIDGIFKSSDDHGQPLSRDGSREYLAQFPKVKIIDVIGENQAGKRNAYLKAAARDKCDAVLVIDSDSYLAGMSNGFARWRAELERAITASAAAAAASAAQGKGEDLDALAMPVYSKNYDGKWYFSYMNLVYLHPERLEYRKRHDAIYRTDTGKRILYDAQRNPILNGVLWVNDHDLRSPERLERGRNIRHNNRAEELDIKGDKLPT